MTGRRLFEGAVHVHHGQVTVRTAGAPRGSGEWFAGQENGLCGAASPGTLFLVTGLHTGPVGLLVEAHDRPPPIDDEWEDVVEVSFHVSAPDVSLVEWGSDGGASLDLARGNWRVRYSARGMDATHATDTILDAEHLMDHYRLDLWPSRPAPDRVVKETSTTAAHRHRAVREARAGGPRPDAPPVAVRTMKARWDELDLVVAVTWPTSDRTAGTPTSFALGVAHVGLPDRDLVWDLYAVFDVVASGLSAANVAVDAAIGDVVASLEDRGLASQAAEAVAVLARGLVSTLLAGSGAHLLLHVVVLSLTAAGDGLAQRVITEDMASSQLAHLAPLVPVFAEALDSKARPEVRAQAQGQRRPLRRRMQR